MFIFKIFVVISQINSQEKIFVLVLKTPLVIKMSLDPNKQQRGLSGSSCDAVCKILIFLFSLPMLFLLPLLCHVLEGMGFLLLKNISKINHEIGPGARSYLAEALVDYVGSLTSSREKVG